MLNYYYDLLDENQLPHGAKFIDPYDHTAFVPIITPKKENLSQFLQRIIAHRTAKDYPQLLESELRALVIANLFESCPKEVIEKFFIKRATLPQISQLISVAKSIAVETVKSFKVSIKKRENRAKKCLDKCVFHDRNNHWLQGANNTVKYFAGLGDLAESEIEKSLGSCKMCGGCALQNKVKFSLEASVTTLTPEQIATYLKVYGSGAFDKCWIFSEAMSDPKLKVTFLNKVNIGLPKLGVDLYNTYLKGSVNNSIKKAS